MVASVEGAREKPRAPSGASVASWPPCSRGRHPTDLCILGWRGARTLQEDYCVMLCHDGELAVVLEDITTVCAEFVSD